MKKIFRRPIIQTAKRKIILNQIKKIFQIKRIFIIMKMKINI
jgi:hypothetical protein